MILLAFYEALLYVPGAPNKKNLAFTVNLCLFPGRACPRDEVHTELASGSSGSK